MKKAFHSQVTPRGKQAKRYIPEIEVPFSGFSPLNTSSSPPGGVNRVKKNEQEKGSPEQPSETSSHNVFLARHLGLGTDEIAGPLAAIEGNTASGRKRKKAASSAKGSRQRSKANNSNEIITDGPGDKTSRRALVESHHPRKRVKTGATTVPEFFPTSKGPTSATYQHGEDMTMPFLRTTPDEDSFEKKYVRPSELSRETTAMEALPPDFDSDLLLSDSHVRELVDETSANSMGDSLPGEETETTHVTDSINGGDDELFNSFINFPPAEESGSEFGGDELPDEDLAMLIDGGVEDSEETLDELDFDGAWLDELDESEVQLLTPCSWPG